MRAQDRIHDDHSRQSDARTYHCGVDAHTWAQRNGPCDGGHERGPWVIASTRALEFTAAAENSATIRPWRIARTRSAMPRTSSRSEDAIKTALPRAERFRTMS